MLSSCNVKVYFVLGDRPTTLHCRFCPEGFKCHRYCPVKGLILHCSVELERVQDLEYSHSTRLLDWKYFHSSISRES